MHRLDNESREEAHRKGQGTRNTQKDKRASIQIKFKGRVDGGTSSE